MESLIVHSGEVFEHVFVNEPVDLHIVQEEGSLVRIHVLNLPKDLKDPKDFKDPKDIHNTITVEQVGTGCRTEIYGLAFLHGDESVTTETHVHHLVGGGSSDQLIKFVLDDHAKGAFLGDLKINPNAQQVEAHQTNRNILLSDDAQMRTRPQLEIYADDVQATHGASTGQLDESALFYMQQRGIGIQKARQLLVNAFMMDVIETISDENIKTNCLTFIERD
ncbi:MAG: SufD family Fe-S cluster assembly protein [Paludibacteraceae bacterium]|nr:SufD family Fe-S cluster assembly protein [Paludibacteraceae bacterium]